jgi:hypothetical protein
MPKKDVCIVDWNAGGRFPTSFWADWDGEKVVFGGDWRDVPDMPAKREPTQKRVYAWAHKHGGLKIGVPSKESKMGARLKSKKHPVPVWSKFFDAYIEAALWSSTDEEGRPLDDNYGPDDIDQESVDKAILEVNAFIRDAKTDLVDAMDSGVSEARLGHDFWLTREGHGTGFWDEGLGELGDRLSEATEPYGSGNIYVHDGKVYFQ